jgi:bacterial/archaeal transporter family protein
MQLWFVLATVVVFLWGFDGILAKLSTPKLGVARIAVLIAVVDGLVYFLGFCYWRDNLPIAFGDSVLAVTSCIIGAVAYLCYFESITDGQIAIAGTISAAYPALTVIGALAFLSETLTTTQAISLVAIIGGLIALSYEPNPGSEHAMPRRSLFFALLAFVLWGFWGLTSKMAINAVGPGNIFGFYVVSSLAAPIVYLLFRRVRPERSRASNPPRIVWVLGAAALALNVCGVFAFSFALNAGFASLVVPISSAYPLVTVILAVALLHEKLDRIHVIALAFVIIGLTMIGITG